MNATRSDLYARAVAAEPALRAIERMVDTATMYIRPADRFCGSCYWEQVLKPLVRPLLGWERGYPPESAADPAPDGPPT